MQINNCIVPVAVPADDSPKFDQYILDSITAAAASSSTSITSSTGGYQNFNGSNMLNAQNSSSDTHEMPQLLNILNELLDGQDIASFANSGGNGDNIQDMEDNYEDDSPRKDDPEEIARVLAQQRAEEISREEQQLRRRMDFLIRRLFKLVARSTGIHVSEEMAGFLEHVVRYSKKKEGMIKEKQLSSIKIPSYLSGTSTELLTSPTLSKEPPINLLSSPMAAVGNKTTTQDNNDYDLQSLPQASSNLSVVDTTLDVIEPPKSIHNNELKPVPLNEMKSFLRRIDNISTMQSTVQTKKALAFKYFTKASPSSNNLSMSSKLDPSSNLCVSAIPKFEDKDIDQVEQTSGLLMSELRLIENQIDSDATASSTGCESADEMTAYNNQYQQPLSM